LTGRELQHWKLLERFEEVLAPTFADPRRTLGYAPYLSLFLFGLFNPAVQTMRQLCSLTELKKVQRATGCGKVSLGSFSEIQAVLDPDLLKQVFEELVQQMPQKATADPRLRHLNLMAQDGSLWSAWPRMAWAQYGVGRKGQAKGVRLHLRFNILKSCPDDALIAEGKSHELDALRQMLVPDQTIVADRFYGKSYKLFGHIAGAGAHFVFRLHDDAAITVEEALPISPADAQAGAVALDAPAPGGSPPPRTPPVAGDPPFGGGAFGRTGGLGLPPPMGHRAVFSLD
jgi:hypothetical protein